LRAGEFVPGAQATVVCYGVVTHGAAELPLRGQKQTACLAGRSNHRLPGSLPFAWLRRLLVQRFPSLNGKYGKQRRAEWKYPGTISVTLADGSAANGNRVGPGFLLLISDERAYAGLK
jgi:hypothetical protein